MPRWFLPLSIGTGLLSLAAAVAATQKGATAPPTKDGPRPSGPPRGPAGVTGGVTRSAMGSAGYRFGVDCRPIVDDAARSYAWARALGRRVPAGLGPGDVVDWGMRQALGPCDPPWGGPPADLAWRFRLYRAFLQGAVEARRLHRGVAQQLLENHRRELVAQGADAASLPRALDG